MAGGNNSSSISDVEYSQGVADSQYNQATITYNHEAASDDYFKNAAEAEENDYSSEMCVRYSEAKGDMTCTDRLDQAQLKVFCTNFKSKLELENERLTALNNTFASASSNLNMKGSTYESLLQQCAAYSAIINCMEMANLMDAREAGLLSEKLGSEFLDGSVILHGIEYSWSSYESECRAYDHCNDMANNCDDPDERAQYRSEACDHQHMANNYFAEWKEYKRLKQEFEDIRDYSADFFINSTALRIQAQAGMQFIAYDFVNGQYVIPEGLSGWFKEVIDVEDDALLEYAKQWQNEDGSWNMDEINGKISCDDDSLTTLDYLALCCVIDSEGFMENHMEEFLESGIVGELKPYEDFSNYEGTWTYRPTKAYQELVTVYGLRLEYKAACAEKAALATLNIDPNATPEEIEKSIRQTKAGARESCNDLYETYNVMYAGSKLFENASFYGTDFDDDAFVTRAYDYGCERVEIKIEREDGYYNVSGDINRVDDMQNVQNDYHYSYEAYGYSRAVNTEISDYIHRQKAEEKPVNVMVSVGGSVLVTGAGFLPEVGPLITGLSMVDGINGGLEATNEYNQLVNQNNAIIYDQDVGMVYDELNVSGSMIISQDGQVTLTTGYVGKDELSSYSDGYNYTYHSDGKNTFDFNPNTFLYEYHNDEDGKYKDELNQFLGYVDYEQG